MASEFDMGGELAQLIVGDGGHDGKAKLGILVKGVAVVCLEEHPHAVV